MPPPTLPLSLTRPKPRPPPPEQAQCIQPWCTKKPQVCAKVLGISDVVISLAGIITILIMSMLSLDLEEEIIFIKVHGDDRGSTKQVQQQVLLKDRIYTLIAKFETKIPCDEIVEKMMEYYEKYLNNTGIAIPPTEVISSNKKPSPNAETECVIHSRTKHWPFTKVEGKQNQRYTISNIAALAIGDALIKDPKMIEATKLSVLTPDVGRVEQKENHENKIGYNPAKSHCVNEVMKSSATDPKEVEELADLVQHLLISSGCISILGGILMTTTAYDTSPIMLTAILVLDGVSVLLIAFAIIHINDERLCLLEYGGVTPIGLESPRFIQTIITYSCAVYAVVYKGYCVLFILSFCRVASKIPHFPETISKTSLMNAVEKAEMISEVADMIRRQNEEKLDEDAEEQELRKSIDEFVKDDDELKSIFPKDDVNLNPNKKTAGKALEPDSKKTTGIGRSGGIHTGPRPGEGAKKLNDAEKNVIGHDRQKLFDLGESGAEVKKHEPHPHVPKKGHGTEKKRKSHDEEKNPIDHEDTTDLEESGVDEQKHEQEHEHQVPKKGRGIGRGNVMRNDANKHNMWKN